MVIESWQGRKRRDEEAVRKKGFDEEGSLTQTTGYRNSKQLFSELSKLRMIESTHMLCEGQDIGLYFKKLKAKLSSLSEKAADEANMPESQKREFVKAIRNFVDDTSMLYKIILAVEADTKLRTTGFEEQLEMAIQSAYNSIRDFYEDYGLILNKEKVKDQVVSIFQEIAKQFSQDKEFCESICKAIKKGLYDDYFDSFIKQFSDFPPLAYSSYTILNYRKSSVFQLFAILISLAEKDKDKWTPEKTAEKLTNQELLFMPLLDPYEESMLNYIITIDKLEEKGQSQNLDVIRAIRKLFIFGDIPYKRPSSLIKDVTQALEEQLPQTPLMNVGAYQNLKQGKIPQWMLLNFVVSTLKMKNKSPAPDVVSDLRKQIKGRTVELFINDFITQIGNSKLREVMKAWLDRIVFDLSTLIDPEGNDVTIAATDGEKIYVIPHLNIFPTRDLNAAMYLKAIIHEKNHIDFGSFKLLTEGKINVDMLERLRGYEKELKERFSVDEKDMKLLSNLLKETLEKTLEKLEPRIKGGDVKIIEIEVELFKVLKEFCNKDKRFKDHHIVKNLKERLDSINFPFLLNYMVNLLEDYRIDNTFIRLNDDKTIYYGINKEGFERIKYIYRFMQYSLLFLSARSYIDYVSSLFGSNVDPETKQKFIHAMDYVLFRSRLGKTLFDQLFYDFEKDPLLSSYLDSIMSELVIERDGEVVVKRYMNDTLKASLELAVFILLFSENFQLPKMRLKGGSRSNKSQGTGTKQTGEEGQETEGGQAKKGEEGTEEGEEEKGAGKENEEEGEERDEEGRGEGKETEEEGEEEKEAGKENEEKGQEGKMISIKPDLDKKARARVSQAQKDEPAVNRETELIKRSQDRASMVVIKRQLIEKYKTILHEIFIGSIEKETVKGSTGPRVDVERLVRFHFMAQKGEGKKPDFFEKERIKTLEEGSELWQRPITIYVGIDTSGSMSGKRIDSAVEQALAIFAAYKELEPQMIGKANVKLRLASIATGDKIIFYEHEPNEFIFETKGKDVVVYYDFKEISGGTDLVGMIKAFEQRIKQIEEETAEHLYRGISVLNPSVLIIYITDFGDNAGDANGVRNAIREFGKFAKEYRERSHVINGKASDVGVSVIFASPEVDDERVRKAAEEVLENGVVVYGLGDSIEAAKKIGEAIEKNIDVLSGLKTSNVKEEV